MSKVKRPRRSDGRTRVAKHYTYCVDHDTGFAPHASGPQCTLCGCNRTVEGHAEPGSWIVGIGGANTHKPGELIYAMKVESTPTLAVLLRQSRDAPYVRDLQQRVRDPQQGLYPSSRALVSAHFYYLGDNALQLPEDLSGLIYRHPNCKTVSELEVRKLSMFLSRRFPHPGIYGRPNNESIYPVRKCDGRRARARSCEGKRRRVGSRTRARTPRCSRPSALKS